MVGVAVLMAKADEDFIPGPADRPTALEASTLYLCKHDISD